MKHQQFIITLDDVSLQSVHVNLNKSIPNFLVMYTAPENVERMLNFITENEAEQFL